MDINIQLIQSVRKRPVLYAAEGCVDLQKRRRLWAEIAEEVNCSEQTAVSRWHILNNYYRRYLESRKSSVHESKESHPLRANLYIKALSFLEPVVVLNKAQVDARNAVHIENDQEIIEPEFIISEIDLNNCPDVQAPVFYEIDEDVESNQLQGKQQEEEPEDGDTSEEQKLQSFIQLENESDETQEQQDEDINDVIEERIDEPDCVYDPLDENEDNSRVAKHIVVMVTPKKEPISSTISVEATENTQELNSYHDSAGAYRRVEIADMLTAGSKTPNIVNTVKAHQFISNHRNDGQDPTEEKRKIIIRLPHESNERLKQNELLLPQPSTSCFTETPKAISSMPLPQTQIRCEDDVFGELVAAHLKKMSPTKKTVMKKEIMNILFG